MSILEQIQTTGNLRGLSPEQLTVLAEEVRGAIRRTVSHTGGHLASNLGVTELTIALHRVFDPFQDRIVWDVGHQCYVHKLLTGRAGRFDTLRQAGGISGFPDPAESPADQFAVGHAGTAAATALGLALGAQLQGTDEKVVAVVGDGSIVNGLSFEGLNNTHLLQRQLLIVLNDNSMAIDRTEGAFARYLTQLRVSRPYEDLQRRTRVLVRRMPAIGAALDEALDRLKGSMKAALQERQIFEQLGIPYFGPVDGHDLPSLVQLLETLKDVHYPVLLHVQTEKGRGFAPARQDPTKFHSPSPFKISGDVATFANEGGSTFTEAFAHSLRDIMRADERVVALTAAMPDGTGLAAIRHEFPERVIDVGIAESAAVDIAAGLAKKGLRPVVAIYSTFMQRGFDQVFQEVSLQGLPVVFCMDRAGLVGGDGAVHHGFCDIALLRTLPNLVLAAPADEADMAQMLRWALSQPQAVALRYPRARTPELPGGASEAIALGKARRLRAGDDAALISYGAVADVALAAADLLAARQVQAAVFDARFAKPLDLDMVAEVLGEGAGPVVTLEDHALAGGFGAAVLEAAQEKGLDTRRLVRVGMPDRFIGADTRGAQLAAVGLSAEAVAEKVMSRRKGA